VPTNCIVCSKSLVVKRGTVWTSDEYHEEFN